jgi:hypothetical protein
MHEISMALKDAKYVLVMVDTSNHNKLKLVPVLVRYFKPSTGVQCKVTDFQNLIRETAEVLASHVMDV